MKRPVVWSNAARDDYFGILRHIASDNPTVAERVAQQLERVAAALSEMPAPAG